jgi:hypothetical protein
MDAVLHSGIMLSKRLQADSKHLVSHVVHVPLACLRS